MPSPLDDPALAGLYPFLVGARQDAGRVDLALLESVRQKATESVEVKQRFFAASGAEVVARLWWR